ncbi:methionine-gamma-lyase [Peptoniphilus koenoeneniae]|uniref:L-methionine gamma-lyase n=1 Tax=Peptoniphilus koenoeneniae TaxID=507751 RepID=A0ABU0AW30_9FIRM|nr:MULTISPECIES: methionine gamma-lyase [Peptoniphilus]ERT57374.1 methionine gamma-lyase [Peptoniphilus sp. BV3C26]MDQ0275031.1 methionine-gamma-lyase [Peptoniphilus koenoeneniae]
MNSKDEMKKLNFDTKCVHAGYVKNDVGALACPIYQTSTFIFDSAEQGGRRFALEEDGYIYSRLGNPTNAQVEAKVAMLEGGEAALSTASGMGAITSAIWTNLKAGDHVLAAKTLYGCTFAFLEHALPRFGVEVDFIDMANLDEVKSHLKPNTKITYLETPANPNMDISDIEAIAKLSHENNKEGLVIVDNTYCSPYISNPLSLGADIVVHSATKYINGHGDVIAGFVIGSQEMITNIRFVGLKDMTGAVLDPFAAYLINRGLKTLPLRMEKHCANAMKVAEFLENHPAVESVAYPGLKSFKYYDLAKKQMKLPGAMISFELKGGIEAGRTLMNSVKLCTLAVSLGDAETLIQHPATMTHSPYSKEEREAAGITDGMVRLSVGLENADDIIADLEQALGQIK